VGTTAVFWRDLYSLLSFLEVYLFYDHFASLVKGFLTKVEISTQNHQSAYKFKYGTSTSHGSKASKRAQKDPPLFPLHRKIRHYSHFTKRFAVIAQGCRVIKGVLLFFASAQIKCLHHEIKRLRGIVSLVVIFPDNGP